MRTLIIHPKDKTTDMLEHVYENHPEYTVCRDGGINRKELMELIETHDRIIMMGHGLPQGLIASTRDRFLVDDSFAPLLKTKDTVSIWCFSDEYFRRHGITGFHTGMIISEVNEEYLMLGRLVLNEQAMLDNFKNLSVCFGECIDHNPTEIRDYMLEHYTGTDAVTMFNRSNFKVLN